MIFLSPYFFILNIFIFHFATSLDLTVNQWNQINPLLRNYKLLGLSPGRVYRVAQQRKNSGGAQMRSAGGITEILLPAATTRPPSGNTFLSHVQKSEVIISLHNQNVTLSNF